MTHKLTTLVPTLAAAVLLSVGMTTLSGCGAQKGETVSTYTSSIRDNVGEATRDGEYALYGKGFRSIRRVRLEAGEDLGFRTMMDDDGETEKAMAVAGDQEIPLDTGILSDYSWAYLGN